MVYVNSQNVCFANQQAALILVDAVLDIEATLNRKSQASAPSQNQLKLHFLSALLQARVIFPEHQWYPLYYEAEKTRARLCLKYLSQLSDTEAGHLSSDQHTVSSAGHSTVKPVVDVFLQCLQSPVFEVRLEVLNSLIKLLNTGGRAHLMEDAGEDSMLVNNEVEHLTEGAAACRTEEVVRQLFDHLLDMGLELENHHECQEKVTLINCLHLHYIAGNSYINLSCVT